MRALVVVLLSCLEARLFLALLGDEEDEGPRWMFALAGGPGAAQLPVQFCCWRPMFLYCN